MKVLKYHLLIVLFVVSLTSFGQNKKVVNIEQAGSIEFSDAIVSNAQRILRDSVKNVILSHENIRMWCDSAYSYTDTNLVDAFGNVHILKDDTLHLYADFINYNGDTKWATARRNVRLVNKSITLTTDSMDFDMTNNIGYYQHHGVIQDSTNTLSSQIGQYYATEDKAFFKTDVEVISEDYILNSDTLIYYTETSEVSIVGPTNIYEEENTLYTESGLYNSNTGKLELLKNSVINTPDQDIKADSIFYDKETGDSEAFGNADIHDRENKLIVRGNKIQYNDEKETALVTDSAHFLLYSPTDTLFLHADSLKTIPDTIPDQKLILAYYNVKFFREDMQGKCDSMVYWTKDSTVQLFHQPVIWSKGNQMSADYIEMIRKADSNDLVKLENNSFIIAQEDSIKFNQIKGRNMLGHIRNNDLYRIDVDGNGQSLYYASNKQGIIGLNKAESSTIQIYLKDSEVKKIAFITSPEGTLLPLFSIMEDEKELPGFEWLDGIRPKTVWDIFNGLSHEALDAPELKRELKTLSKKLPTKE